MSRMRKVNIKSDENLVNWEVYLKEFLIFKRAEKLSSTTISDYDYHIRQFFRRYPTGDVKNNLYLYLAEDIANATFNLRLTYLKCYLNYLVDEKIISENPLSTIHRKKTEARIVDVSVDDLKKLILLPDLSTYAGLRDKAFICLTLDNGIRPSEASRLLVDDFNKTHSHIVVRAEASKTRRERILPVSPITVNLIVKLINVRPKYWKGKIPLFASSDGTVLNRHRWRDRLRIYSRMLDTNISPYDLRHCFALNFLRNGGNALFLQQIMGHSDMNMTKKYIAATNTDLRKALQEASPLNTLVKPTRVRKINLD